MKQDGKWDGFRTLVLIDKIKECEDIISFYFKAADGEELTLHKAGQFLPFSVFACLRRYKFV